MEVPYNFRWIDEGRLAGSAMIDQDEITAIKEKGIKTIISFEAVDPETEAEIKKQGLGHEKIFIEDFGTPSNQDIDKYFSILDMALLKGPVLIHCQAGIGRTGTMGALYLIKKKGFTAEEALEKVGGAETSGQANLIRWFARRQST